MLSVVVPAYSNAAVVREAVGALARAATAVADDVEILVVLNSPLPELAEVGGIQLLPVERNLGFAGGVMHALRHTAAEWVAVVNDDCLVEPESLRALLEAGTADGRVGSVTGLITFADQADVVNAAGIDIDELGVATERLLGRPVASASGPTEVFGGSGAFTLYRRGMLEEVGGFDESFFAYYEDADLAWRARMAGWRCAFVPAARARHAHSSSLGHGSSSKHYLVGRNRVRMLAKNAMSDHLRRQAARIVAYDLAYVAFAAVRYRTLAPLAGRLAGLREWRRYRSIGAAQRRPVQLAPSGGVRAALQRDRVYRGGAAFRRR